jgi:hypothetical protein
MSNELIQELEDAEKQEKMMRYWNEYGGYIIAGALLAILFTGLITGYQKYQRATNENQTIMLVNALESDDRAQALLDTTPELGNGLRAVSGFSTAAYLLSQENPAKAMKAYEKTAADGSVPENFQDLAKFMALRLKWDLRNETDREDETNIEPGHFIQQLEPLMAKASSPWQAHAYIQAALIMAEQNNFAKSIEYLNAALELESIPPSLIERARALRHVYTLEYQSQEPAEKTPSQEAQG